MFQSIQEINRKFNGQWVFLINCNTDEDGNLVEGEVMLHSKSRDEVFRGMYKYKDTPSMISIRYAGKIPEGVNVLL
ncbi:hypothetical protein RBH29_04715 [Herbivorax sp. ANBcel31]|uniref:hypothetical protein n=1 Tax=Herbivorax sp. ANBcel31 TaxID=3069754 RepID=UPI0027B1260A|nr:hypothetical protein [Herbivorax sp. ANBcel31]MDQ2085736.1 hypothetical protein [Herbivorax sp. ANBcel31]